MTLINISLCLPELDIIALHQKRSIVAVTQRFIVPDRSFALLPCRVLSASIQPTEIYHHQILTDLQSSTIPNSEPVMTTHWAQCVFCQQIADEGAIALISDRTIWTKKALLSHLKTRGKFFLSFVRVYELPQTTLANTEPAYDQLYKFLPLPQDLEVTPQGAVLSDAEFGAAKQALLEPADLSSSSSSGTKNNEEEEISSSPAENILHSPDWVSKISEIGNSSEGHTFEKLVRKALLELGFSNSQNQSATSLDPNSTGGAGGLDFYADQPYKIVGECKATKTKKVGSDTASQIVRLGLQNLREDEYLDCIKVVVAAGALTNQVKQMSEKHRINVIRPETIQQLVESKINFQGDFDLIELESYLKNQPFGEKADKKITDYLEQCFRNWQGQQEHHKIVGQIVSSLKELSLQSTTDPLPDFSVSEIWAHHNAKYQPVISKSKVDMVLESQRLSAQNNKIKRRNHQNGLVGYYLREVAPKL
jgi:hypothetical protein